MSSSDSTSVPGGHGGHGSDSLVFKVDRPWPNARMRVGAIIGHTTPESVRMWLRTGSPGRFTLFLCDCAAAMGSKELRAELRTPPVEDKMADFQIALFSCHMPFLVSGLFKKRTRTDQMDVWDFMDETLGRHRDSVDVVIAGGDQAYSDGVDTLNIWKLLNRTMRIEGDKLLPREDDMATWFRDIYRGYWGFDEVRKVFDSYPTYMIWDDHEILDGWGSHYLDDDGPHAAALPHALNDATASRSEGGQAW